MSRDLKVWLIGDMASSADELMKERHIYLLGSFPVYQDDYNLYADIINNTEKIPEFNSDSEIGTWSSYVYPIDTFIQDDLFSACCLKYDILKSYYELLYSMVKRVVGISVVSNLKYLCFQPF